MALSHGVSGLSDQRRPRVFRRSYSTAFRRFRVARSEVADLIIRDVRSKQMLGTCEYCSLSDFFAC